VSPAKKNAPAPRPEPAGLPAPAEGWALLDAVPDVVVVLDGDTIRYINRPGADLLGAPPAQIVGQPMSRFFDPRALHNLLVRAQAAAAAPAGWLRTRLIRQDGSSADADLRVMPIPAQRALAVIARPVDPAAILADAASTDAHARDGMNQLVASMAHELRTPLNAIIGFSEILTQQMFGELNQRYVAYASDIAASGQHLLRIINDILDYAKVEAGEVMLRIEAVQPEELVRTSLRLVAGQADQAGIALGDDLAGAWPRVYADATKVKQILVNLLMNAIKFTPRGGRVTVRLRVDPGKRLAVSVIDTGVGMTEAEMAEAILPFRQPKRPPDGGYSGTGLGLPIAKALAALHGGDLRISSAPGRGTEVMFTLATTPPPPHQLMRLAGNPTV
jgi:signal transduction histidine kinase